MFKTPSHAVVVAVGWKITFHPLNKNYIPCANVGFRPDDMCRLARSIKINKRP